MDKVLLESNLEETLELWNSKKDLGFENPRMNAP
jgi:hypothetical protein